MAAAGQEQLYFRFGVFELNLETEELRKHGIRLKLQQQPLQVLVLLLENPGQVITRDQIQARLWPENTFVDFENAINSAVRKLRDVLGDSPTNPRFIETLSRRGYRFIADVTSNGTNTAPPLPDRNAATSLEQSVTSPEHMPSRSRVKVWSIASAAVLAFVAIAIVLTLQLWRPEKTRVDAPLPAVPLTGKPGYEGFPAFSPEGSRVAFAWEPPDRRGLSLYVQLLGAGEPVRLTNARMGDFAPAWSRDGRYVAFLRAQDLAHASIIIVPAVGGRERELARISLDTAAVLEHDKASMTSAPFLAWSVGGNWLVCLEQQTSGTAASMTRVSVETGEKRPLVLPIANTRGDGALAVSPDGHRLAFTRGWGAFERDIYEVAISAEMVPNGQVRRLTFDKTEVDGIAWTADGRRLVFSSKRGGRYELWEVPLGSATPVKLAAAGDDPHNPAIPARGDHLVYSHQNLDWNIWRARVGSRAEGNATEFISSTRLEFHAVYSPDGHHIAFESNRSGDMAIWTCNADGTNAVQLTTFGKHWAGSPQWSPDGRFIAFDGDAAGDWDVYVINANGGKPIRMTGDAGEEFRPSWSRDGKWIYYCSSRNNHSEVRKVPSTGGAEVQVTKNGGSIAFESADGKDLYYTTDLPGLWKMPVAGGPETKVLNSLQGANFVPAEHGLYFIEDQPSKENSFRLKLLDPASGAVKTMAVLPGPVGDEMSISPDEKWMLFFRPDREGSELMLIENFR